MVLGFLASHATDNVEFYIKFKSRSIIATRSIVLNCYSELRVIKFDFRGSYNCYVVVDAK